MICRDINSASGSRSCRRGRSRVSSYLLLAAAWLGAGLSVPAQGQTVQTLGTFQVSAQSNIFASGLNSSGAVGGGLVPQAIALPPGSNRSLEFTVTGNAISCCGTAGPHGADGGTNLSTNISSAPAISGVEHHSRNIFLLGVLLGPTAPVSPAPPRLSYYSPVDTFTPPAGSVSDRLAEYFPGFRQSFFIGDGQAAGAQVQRFHLPDGATRLFLGFADGLNLGDPRFTTPSPAAPCCYTDNTGTLTVTVRLIEECATSEYPPSCTPDCQATIAAADDISARAMNGETSFSRNEYLILFKAVQCRTGVPANVLKVIAFSEGLGRYYEDLTPRQFIEPCQQSYNLSGWSYPELWSRYYGPSWPLLAVDAPASLQCDTNPANNGCQCPPRRQGAPYERPEPGNCSLPVPSPDRDADWAAVWPFVVHATLNDDRPKSSSFGLGVMQMTYYIRQIVQPRNSGQTTYVGKCFRASTEPIYPKGGEPGADTVPMEPLPNFVRVMTDPQFNILEAAELILYKAQFGSDTNPRPDADQVALKVDSPPYGPTLVAGPSAPSTQSEWNFQGAQFKAIPGCTTTACVQEYIDGAIFYIPNPDGDAGCFLASPYRYREPRCQRPQAHAFATEEPILP